MKKEIKHQLLQDISKLIIQYGHEVFEQLADDLREGRLVSDLEQILSTVAETQAKRVTRQRRSSSAKTGSDHNRLRRKIEESGRDTGDKELLLQLNDALSAKKVLASLPKVRAFADEQGLGPLRHKTRARAIEALMSRVMVLEKERLTTCADAMLRGGSTQSKDRTLDEWSNIIMGTDDALKDD